MFGTDQMKVKPRRSAWTMMVSATSNSPDAARRCVGIGSVSGIEERGGANSSRRSQ